MINPSESKVGSNSVSPLEPLLSLIITAMDHPQGRPHRESARPIKYNPVPIGGPDRPPVTQSPSPGTIFASPCGDADADGDADGEGDGNVDVDVNGDGDGDKHGRPGPVKGNANGAPKRELESPHIKREPDLRDGSDYPPDRARSSIATRRSSTAYPDVINEDTRSEDADGEPHKKRQKRNKPTLSCFECVERKTKTECKYAHVANLLEETSRSVSNGRRMTKPPKKKPGPSGHTRAAVALSTGLLSTIPYTQGTGSNLFGIGSAHPFANIWTSNGRLDEVIGIMPNKLQCDILVSRYFECVDPVYPMLDQQSFLEEYEKFWSLPLERRCQSDASFVALINVMLALGTQFHRIPATPHEASGAAELHASASNQALRMGSYLSSASIRSIQTMVLMVYFLINDNHASDGWSFAGILMRQAYAMGLHRDPNVVTPDATGLEKQERRKLWQAVLLQDTFLTILLSLPPNATHTDVNVDDLVDEPTGYTSINHNGHSNSSTDMAYIRGSWALCNLVQESICSPRSLDLPICATPRHKTKLVADFRGVYRAFPDIFRSWDAESLNALAQTNNRVARQTLFLTSNYFHNLMLVHASESPEVPVNVRGTLEAAHDAINAFFMLYALFEHEARTWWVFNHRAFLEALCIGSVLRETAREPGGIDVVNKDQLFIRGRSDIARMVQIMTCMAEGDSGSEVARTRAQVLSELL
ncbi:hypothetical protein VPNG_02921 [Cytospora leucostoma]|uniref:Xylanolytic transcriptional activator regulatory domain-containing protein n=1 Tax=Cytospora leucostoma TaxID=1230097 RepID=A0A423XGS5_9PEZI|nr:hypothetical protein VPNG_02921 [Cytospora leucostoma]